MPVLVSSGSPIPTDTHNTGDARASPVMMDETNQGHPPVLSPETPGSGPVDDPQPNSYMGINMDFEPGDESLEDASASPTMMDGTDHDHLLSPVTSGTGPADASQPNGDMNINMDFGLDVGSLDGVFDNALHSSFVVLTF